MSDDPLRLEALRLHNKMIRSRRYQRHQAKTWGRNTPVVNVVAVLSTDKVRYAEQRVAQVGGEADVVVYWPDEGTITIAHVRSHHDSDGSTVLGIDPVDVHDDSTVGMLWALIRASAGAVYTTTRAEVLA